MAERPYFSITPASFEKNAGYKSTVHALAELIDNSFEAEASSVAVVLQVDHDQRLESIAVVDNGEGMHPDLLQAAVCEKAGSFGRRERSSGPAARGKLGKYGVGLPKASISQCNKFTVWSWTEGGPLAAFRNGVDITDLEWIEAGANVPDSATDPAPQKWLAAAEFDSDVQNGTIVLWELLDGVTWKRARWGEHQGLIPNLQFAVGRVYRKLIASENSPFSIRVAVVDRQMQKIESFCIEPNDPLYLTEGLNIPRHTLPDGSQWPPDDPMFDDAGDFLPEDPELTIEVARQDGGAEEVTVRWRASAARKKVFAIVNNSNAGSLPHGKHAARNVGLSILREGREITMSSALANPSEPRERWFGVEIDLPNELDTVLGMTNNKQEYTRLERILADPKEEYQEDGETTQETLERIHREDPAMAICLRIAWRTRDIWVATKSAHMRMREDPLRVSVSSDQDQDQDEGPLDPELEAEAAASSADEHEKDPAADEDPERFRGEVEQEFEDAGVPKLLARELAARVVERGLQYAISERSGLGSPFFTVTRIRGIKFIQLNSSHPAYKYIKRSINEDPSLDSGEAVERLADVRLATLLMLEAWGKLESSASEDERMQLHRVREDWGRVLKRFVEQMEQDRAERSGFPEA